MVSAFKKASIFPFHRGVFTDDDILGSYVTDRPAPMVSREIGNPLNVTNTAVPTEFIGTDNPTVQYCNEADNIEQPQMVPSSTLEALLDVQYLGRKLGLSVGLTTDYKGGLHYFLPRDNVAVRWDTQIPLAAESHTITLQSAELLPSVSQLFVDQQRQVWAVTNNNGSKQHCVLLQTYRQRTHFYQ
ncbi:unnamed protein product [Timema podura]|uniref:Uncharacterized protein n=1 Tax=Timema podura TaxID=61482 RepID=A0ABN7P7A0_TIMPD|nr:unnamed protein product [Timema podura]